MARTALSAQQITSDGAVVTLSPANADGHSYPLRAGNVLHVNNGSGASINVTIQTPMVIDNSLAVPDRVIAVPAGAFRLVNLGEKPEYRQNDGTAFVDFSAVASVTCGVFRV